MQEASQEVLAIIDQLNDVLRDMEEVLETLDDVEVQQRSDEREIESLRQALRQFQRPPSPQNQPRRDRDQDQGQGRRPQDNPDRRRDHGPQHQRHDPRRDQGQPRQPQQQPGPRSIPSSREPAPPPSEPREQAQPPEPDEPSIHEREQYDEDAPRRLE